jgi:hypothetical protein
MMTGGRLERLVPLAGVLYGVMFVIGFAVTGETPDPNASADEVIKYYDDAGKVLGGIIALALVAIMFMFFAAALRTYFKNTGPEWLATFVFAGAVVYVVGLTQFASSQFALLQAADDKNVQVAQSLNIIDSSNFPTAFIGLTLIMFGTAWHVLSSGSLPKWLGWVSLVLGIVGFAGPVGFAVFLLSAPWTVVIAIMLYRRQDASVTPATA